MATQRFLVPLLQVRILPWLLLKQILLTFNNEILIKAKWGFALIRKGTWIILSCLKIIEFLIPQPLIGGGFNVNCPWCDTKKDSFNLGINPSEDYGNCWKCGGHDIKDVLALLLGIPRRDVSDIIKPYMGRKSNLPSVSTRKASATFLSLPSDTFTSKERKYLEKRGFDADYLHEKYGVVGGGITGKWKFRIIIPIYYKGRLVSWTARSILSKDELKELDLPRYKNLSIEESVYPAKDIFFNLDNCVGDSVVLTEGCFDVMRLGDINGNSDNVICSLGTQLTQAQIRLLSERFNKVYIMFDNEAEAQEKARKFGMQIASMGLEVEVIDAFSEFGVNDGAECNEEQVASIRRELGF